MDWAAFLLSWSWQREQQVHIVTDIVLDMVFPDPSRKQRVPTEVGFTEQLHPYTCFIILVQNVWTIIGMTLNYYTFNKISEFNSNTTTKIAGFDYTKCTLLYINTYCLVSSTLCNVQWQRKHLFSYQMLFLKLNQQRQSTEGSNNECNSKKSSKFSHLNSARFIASYITTCTNHHLVQRTRVVQEWWQVVVVTLAANWAARHQTKAPVTVSAEPAWQTVTARRRQTYSDTGAGRRPAHQWPAELPAATATAESQNDVISSHISLLTYMTQLTDQETIRLGGASPWWT